MAKIQLDVPGDLHLRIKQLQLIMEGDGNRKSLKDLYLELLSSGITEKEKAAK